LFIAEEVMFSVVAQRVGKIFWGNALETRATRVKSTLGEEHEEGQVSMVTSEIVWTQANPPVPPENPQ
jgi:hypothetical protein